MRSIESARPDNFLSDQEVSKLLSVSPAWLRKQRYLRKIGEDHIFDVSPVYLGRFPRYREQEIINWSQSL